MPVMPHYPEMLVEAADVLAGRLEALLGLTPEMAAEKAFEATEFLREHWGGQDIYIPKGAEFELSQKYQRVFERWKAEGFTPAMARDEDLTMRRCRVIVNLVRKARRQKADPCPLFPESASA